ncbi:MAG: ABC transporter permease [Alphaproteobacteria bacterium]
MNRQRMNPSDMRRGAGIVIACVAAALLVSAAFLLAAGRDPLQAGMVLFGSAFGSIDGVAETITRAVPLALAGLGIAIAFRASMYNIGGDGQLMIGAIGGVAALQWAGDAGAIGLPWLLLASALAGGLYGALAGWLRARFDASEIIVTIMLNYVAFQMLAWLVRGPLQESQKIMPRSGAIPEAAQLPELIEAGQLHAGVLVALALALLVHVVMRRTSFGFRLMAVGENPRAAAAGGIGVGGIIILSMAASGALCGLAGGVEVAGVFHRLEENMAPGLGITAIAVALLARLNTLAVPFAALLFGALTVGAGALQRQMAIPFPLLWIIDAVVIVAFLFAGARWRRAQPAA